MASKKRWLLDHEYGDLEESFVTSYSTSIEGDSYASACLRLVSIHFDHANKVVKSIKPHRATGPFMIANDIKQLGGEISAVSKDSAVILYRGFELLLTNKKSMYEVSVKYNRPVALDAWGLENSDSITAATNMSPAHQEVCARVL